MGTAGSPGSSSTPNRLSLNGLLLNIRFRKSSDRAFSSSVFGFSIVLGGGQRDRSKELLAFAPLALLFPLRASSALNPLPPVSALSLLRVSAVLPVVPAAVPAPAPVETLLLLSLSPV